MEQTKLTGYPSVDKPWLKYYSEEAINAKLPECTVFEYLWKNNKDYLGDVALLYFGKKITYSELFRETERVRNALLNEGIRKGDKVILFTSSTPETVYAVLALSPYLLLFSPYFLWIFLLLSCLSNDNAIFRENLKAGFYSEVQRFEA